MNLLLIIIKNNKKELQSIIERVAFKYHLNVLSRENLIVVKLLF